MAVRVYAKRTCPHCGKRIGNNNYQRHLRSCTGKATTPQIKENPVEEYTQQSFCNMLDIETPERVADDVEILVFDLNAFKIDEFTTYMIHKCDEQHCVWCYSFPTDAIFVCYAYRKVYIPVEEVLKHDPIKDMYKGKFKPIFGDLLYNRFVIPRKKWENRESTRKIV